MCAEPKTNRESYVRLDLNSIEQLLDELSDASGMVQYNLGILDSCRLLSIKNCVDSQDRWAALHAFGSTYI